MAAWKRFLLFWSLLPAVTMPVRAASLAPDTPAGQAEAHRLAALPAVAPPRGHRVVIDRSGRKEKGKASSYSQRFAGRRMADGRRLDPRSDAAASRSLPLGTTARVLDLRSGKSARVVIKDHGPFVDGRVIDLTPHTARRLGLTRKQGVAPVIVAPVTVPQPDGGMKAGAGAAEHTP